MGGCVHSCRRRQLVQSRPITAPRKAGNSERNSGISAITSSYRDMRQQGPVYAMRWARSPRTSAGCAAGTRGRPATTTPSGVRLGPHRSKRCGRASAEEEEGEGGGRAPRENVPSSFAFSLVRSSSLFLTFSGSSGVGTREPTMTAGYHTALLRSAGRGRDQAFRL